MQVVQEAPTVGHIYNQYKKRHLEAKFTTNASYTKLGTKWRNPQIDFCKKNDLSYKLNTLGPLCLRQCFMFWL